MGGKSIVEFICSVSLGFMDWVLLSRPRIWGVGFLAYAIIYIWILLAWLAKILVTMDISIYDILGLVLIFIYVGFSIGYIGSIIVDRLDYIKCYNKYNRKIQCMIYDVINSIFYNKEDFPEYGKRTQLVSFILSIFFPSIFLILTLIGSSNGLMICELVSQGSVLGMVAFVIVAILHVFVAFFWLYSTSAVSYILWIHSWILSKVFWAIKMELNGVDSISLDRVLMDILRKDKPALEFMKFRNKLMGITETLMSVMKRLLIIMMTYILGSIAVDLLGEGIDLLGISITVVASILLSMTITYIIYIIYKWSSELNNLIIVELKNIQLYFYKINNIEKIRASQEIESLVRELGHTMVSSREIWELLTALLSLIATIIAIVSRFGIY